MCKDGVVDSADLGVISMVLRGFEVNRSRFLHVQETLGDSKYLREITLELTNETLFMLA